MLFQCRAGKGAILPTLLVKPHSSVGNVSAFAQPTCDIVIVAIAFQTIESPLETVCRPPRP